MAGRGTAGYHISLDMDWIDPEDAPGVGTPVRGGATYREAHLAMEIIADHGRMLSFEIVEVNPVIDEHNRTADLAVPSWRCRRSGKRFCSRTCGVGPRTFAAIPASVTITTWQRRSKVSGVPARLRRLLRAKRPPRRISLSLICMPALKRPGPARKSPNASRGKSSTPSVKPWRRLRSDRPETPGAAPSETAARPGGEAAGSFSRRWR